MRSYYSHLETFSKPKTDLSRPVLRASAIFPVFHQKSISSRLAFMGYWMLKRNIKEIAAVISLRDQKGTLIAREVFQVNEAKCFRIEVKDLLAKIDYPLDSPFEGSIESEFFSTSNLFFPYPAVVVNYYGPKFSTVVHTAQRVFNDYEDSCKNSVQSVPESGFNWHVTEDQEPFISFINGPTAVKSTPISMLFYNFKDEKLHFEHTLENLAPYETTILYPARLVDLKSFYQGKLGSAKLNFKLFGVFPRLLVGNLDKKLPGISITHSYYDCSKESGLSDYWAAEDDAFYQASLMIPVDLENDLVTKAFFYPIYSPAEFVIDIELYDERGKVVLKKQEALTITSSEDKLHWIDFKSLAKNISEKKLAARLIARGKSAQDKIPSRIKLALDIGHSEKELPCNICTNLQPFVPAWKDKPTAFKWAPILTDQGTASLWLLNSSPEKNYTKTARVSLTFFRESDEERLSWDVEIGPNSFLIISPEKSDELKTFFQGKIGWATIVSDNPYLTTFYFSDHTDGIVGGDHGF